MFEVIFLIVLASVWIILATIQDVKMREVANWLNFSLIIFALVFRFLFSIFAQDNFNFFIQGLIGFGIFFALGNVFYYSHLFAGGDAKLLIALGPILPFYTGFISNLKLLTTFLILFLIAGAIYGLSWSVYLTIKNRKKIKPQIKIQFNKFKRIAYMFMFIGIILMILGFINCILLIAGIFIFVLPNLYIYSKSVDESCMIKRIKTKELREGDWLYTAVKLGKQNIKAKWEGLSNQEIKQLQKKKKFVFIRQGIPFVPAFLIAFILFVVFYFRGIGFF